MPGSAISAGSGSITSSSSRRAKTRQYRMVAPTSQVDESLFGEHHSTQKRHQKVEDRNREEAPHNNIEQQAAERSQQRRSGGKAKTKKATVQVITKDLIRNLIVPEDDPSGNSIIMSGMQLHRIRQASRVLSEEEKKDHVERLKRIKEQLLDDVQDRKNYMKRQDLNRKKNEKLSELEEEEREKGEYLRKKANEQLQEQEDEIKKLNELILNAKCHAIRDAQIVEKGQVRQEMEHEEIRLDDMMEVDRVNAIKVESSIDKTRKEQRLLGAMKIMEQIQENEQERLLDLERKDQENRAMQKYLDKLCEEEADKLDKRRDDQQNLREELNQCNADIIRRKTLDKEQDRMIESKVLEYQKAKAEREAAFEKEQEQIRIEKEREVARLRALQERARDEQAERDALRAKRAQEQAEREWRSKESEESRRKAETESMLKLARSNQMEQKEHFLAVQAQRERADFERVLKAQQELVEKEKREDHEKKSGRMHYADEVRAQIRDKESQKIEARNAFFEEGVRLDEEAKARRLRLEEIKRKKLNELRKMGLAEKYVAEVARKAQIPLDVSS